MNSFYLQNGYQGKLNNQRKPLYRFPSHPPTQLSLCPRMPAPATNTTTLAAHKHGNGKGSPILVEKGNHGNKLKASFFIVNTGRLSKNTCLRGQCQETDRISHNRFLVTV